MAGSSTSTGPTRPVRWKRSEIGFFRSREEVWLAAGLVLVVVGLSWGLGALPLGDPDEGRNAEVGREMAETGDFVLPRLNGLPYVDKPVLYFAAVATSLELFGRNEAAARLPSLLFMLATAALIGVFAGRRIGRMAGWITAIAFLTAPLVVVFARSVIMDSLLTLWVTLAIVAFYAAVEAPSGKGARAALVAWAAMGLGVLTKGPVALLLPLLVALPYAAWRRRSRAVWPLLGPLVMIAVVAPWVWAVSLQVPDFLRYVVVTETWARLSSDELERSRPFWYFAPYFLAGAFPWCYAVLAGLREDLRRWRAGTLDPRVVFLLLWVFVPLIFFSLSSSKRGQYILPILPAVAALTGLRWTSGGTRAGVRLAASGLAMLGVVLIVAPWGVVPEEEMVFSATARAAMTSWGVSCVAAAWIAWRHRASRLWIPVLALALPFAALSAATLPATREPIEHRSALGPARAIDGVLTEETEVFGAGAYRPSLAFYLDRNLVYSSSDGKRLTSNYVLRNYDRFVSDGPSSTLRSPDALMTALEDCDRPRVFYARTDFASESEQIARYGVPLLYADEKLAAYGPHCAEPGLPPKP